ncbi:nitrilase-related carbon-nitrogen hydrolase [Sulfurimonas sp.]|uniref:nitrilase-related carbon-nitrogen hydrolase n=1 Tax=Sulfurimonas sp. TaxID=2022749 RepID=UPI0025EF4CF3|nr:nitrilase-related carbon-nitrogen hydrolase [Sulfurimonas sp.]MDD5156545.1 nitrilase [Sulfurimonas sp.]
MRVTIAQTMPKLSRINYEESVALIEQYKDKSDLIVFPELSLNGYMLQDGLHDEAWRLDEFDAFKKASLTIDIVVGAAIKNRDETISNSALYFSNGELLAKHNKVHLPNYGMFEEARYFKAGEYFDSLISRFGKISMLVCEDLWHEAVHEDLVKQNPDYIIVLAASPARGFSDSRLEIEDKWYDIIKKVAKKCSAKLIFVNRVGFEDGLGFWGGSCVIDENSNIMYKLPRYEKSTKTFNI